MNCQLDIKNKEMKQGFTNNIEYVEFSNVYKVLKY